MKSTTSRGGAVDAVVIGAGHNGLVAAALLADAGWDVLVLEAQAEPGGAVKSAELTPGYLSDLYSAFYPLSVTSPALEELHLEDHGLRWTHAPAVVGHARSATDEDAPLIYRDIDHTAAELDRHHPGDGSRWRALFDQWQRIKGPLLSTLFAPFPPVRGPSRLLRTLGTAGALELAHLMLLPAGVMAQQLFDGDAARLLLLGNAMHADVPIDAPGSGVMGYLLIMMAQDGGFPVPVGGAGQLTAALVHRAASAGAQIDCQRPVTCHRRERRTGGRGAHRRRRHRAGTSGGDRQHLGAAAVPESASRRRAARVAAAKPRAFCLGHTRSQSQLRVERHHPVAVGKSQRRRHRPSRRRSRRIDPLDGRPEHRDASRPSVHVVRTDDDRRPQPVSRRDRERVGIHASASGYGRRRVS